MPWWKGNTFLTAIFLCMMMSASAQSFVENKGQWEDHIRYRLELNSADIYLEAGRMTIDMSHPDDLDVISAAHLMKEVPYPDIIRHHAYQVEFLNAAMEAPGLGRHVRTTNLNYFLGNDSTRWASNVAMYDKVTYDEIYPGVDLEYYTQNGNLKYDLILAPGADVSLIEMAYHGVIPKLDRDGNLRIETEVNAALEKKPFAYQWVDGKQVEVSCEYKYRSSLTFKLGDYDETLPLVIDPELKFSTFSGSFSDNFGYTATFDQFGFLYSGSSVFGNDYPSTIGAFSEEFNGGVTDIAISKYDTTGTFMVYSTYIGGFASELPHSLIVNENNELILFGTTSSNDYPITGGAHDNSFGGGQSITLSGLGTNYESGADIILSILSEEGDDLVASTFVGGSANDGVNLSTVTNYNYADEVRGEVDIDQEGNLLVVTCSNTTSNTNDFPITPGVIDPVWGGGNQEGVIFKMSADLETLIWSTYFGGNGQDAALSIAANSQNQVVVSGGTSSTDLPTTAGVLAEDFIGGIGDAWVLVMSEDGQQIIDCTYWGTTERDQAYMVELDSEDNIHLFGQTWGGDDLIINADYFNTNSGQFLTKMDAAMENIIWSTTFGNGNGQPNISPTAFSVDICNRVYLSGWGGSVQGANLTTTGLETTSDAFQDNTLGNDFYLMAMADDASELVFATFYGGDQSSEHVDGGTSRFDKKGKVYQSVCAGCGGNSDFPILPTNAHSSTNNSPNCNNGVFKMDFELPAVIADFFAETICANDTAQFVNTSLGGVSFEWDFGDTESSDEQQPTHIYTAAGNYDVTLIINDPMSCNLSDTIIIPINVLAPPTAVLDSLVACENEAILLGPDAIEPDINYSWDNQDLINNPNVPNPAATISESTVFTLSLNNGICGSTAEQVVIVEPLEFALSEDTLICLGDEIDLSSTSFGTSDTYVWSSDPTFTDVLAMDSLYTFTPLVSTTLYANTGELCKKEGEVTISVSSDQLSFSQNQFVCADDPVSISLSNQFPDIDISVDWSPDTDIVSGDGTNQIDVQVDEATWFRADVMNEYGCEISDSVLVEVSPLSFISIDASADIYDIPVGGIATIMADPATGYTYQWSPGTGLTNPNGAITNASPPETTTYTISIIDQDINGSCVLTDTVTIKVFEFVCGFPVSFLPNAFTPNGDGANDLLYVRGPYVESIHLAIYDRWGEKVFETFDKEIPWDGTYEGRELDPAVYVYHLTLNCIDGQETFEKGNITLTR